MEKSDKLFYIRRLFFMKNLTWKAILKKKRNGKISVKLEVRYKKSSYTTKVPDIKMLETVDDYDKQLEDGLKAAFGKKRGKKIADQVIKDFSEI
jgi:hypothetical protein